MIIKLKDLENKEFRLMPNINDYSNNIIINKTNSKRNIDSYGLSLVKSSERGVSYIKSDGKIHLLIFGNTILSKIKYFFTGCSINSDGLILGDSSVKSYTISENGMISTFDKKKSGEKSDISILSPYNLFDIRNGYKIIFKYNQIDGFDNYYDFRFLKDIPLYTDDMDQQEYKTELTNMYEHIKNPNSIVDNYYKELKRKSPDLLIDDEIREYIIAKKTLEKIR